MPKIIRNLQASCNLLNPRQKRLYDFVIEQAGPNVSDWMKGLIEREMVRVEMLGVAEMTERNFPLSAFKDRSAVSQPQAVGSDVARGFI